MISDPFLAHTLDRVNRFERLLRAGRFTLYARRETTSRWAAPLTPSLTVTGAEHQPGRIRVTLLNPRAGGRLLVKTAAAPAWQLAGPDGARLAATRDGLMEVRALPVGVHALTLTYEAPWWPWWITLVGWGLIVGVFFWGRRSGGRQ